MSVSAAIANRYDNDSDDEIVALRTAAGFNKLWVSVTPSDVDLPYMRISQVGPSTQQAESKGQTARAENFNVQLDVWASTKAEVESLLDLLEAAYWGKPLTITGGQWMATYLDGRMTPEEEKKALWRGFLQLVVRIQKSR